MSINPILFCLLVLTILFSSCHENRTEVPIKITRSNLINTTGFGDPMALFDEQDTTIIPKTLWETSQVQSHWPGTLIIDLGRKHKITGLVYFDGEKRLPHANTYLVNRGQVAISAGQPFEWDEPLVSDINNIEKWIKVDFVAETRYLRVQKISAVQYVGKGGYSENCDVALNEMILHGYPLEEEQDAAKPSYTSKVIQPPTADKFIGMNSYLWTPDEVHEAVGIAREYRLWKVNGVLKESIPISWEPIVDGSGGSEYNKNVGKDPDAYYAKMNQMGVDIVPCIHRHIDEKNNKLNKPNFDQDPLDPRSYSLMADYSFQYVARYGSQKVDERLLRTTEASPKKTGLGYIRYFENWNEGDRYWGGDPRGYFSPYEFAAFCSASYDGHRGEMGEGYGVKSADPGCKLVMGGLAILGVGYVKAMKLWADKYRGGSFPADVLNFHHYNNTLGRQHAKVKAYGISPEADHFKERMQEVVQWRNEHLPGKEVWVSEFGWDTDEGTFVSATGHEGYPDQVDYFELQAIWLVRGYLAGMAAGVDRMMMFLANDIDREGVYMSSGFFDLENNYKPSWYYVRTLRTALTQMRFQQEVVSTHEKVWIYAFKNSENGSGAYVVWCPTSDGTTVQNYQLQLTENTGSATLISLRDKEKNGVSKPLDIMGGKIEIDVSERPVIILVDRL